MDADTLEMIPSSTRAQSHGRLIFAAVIICSIISLLALILSAVSLSDKGTTNITVPQGGSNSGAVGTGSSTDKIWKFAIGHDGTNLEYIDDKSGTVRGFHVDLVNAVCEVANKNCVLVWDLYNNCWDSQPGELPRGGTGLMGGWYDGCTGWFGTYERTRVFQFTDAFRQAFDSVLWVKVGNPRSIDPTNIRGKTIGFLDGSATDEHCLARNNGPIVEAKLPTGQIRHYVTPLLLSQAIISGDVDAAFANNNILSAFTGVTKIGNEYSNCVVKAGAMMMRKDSSLASWWNPAFARLQETSKYTEICDRVAEVHGDQPGGDVSVICL